MSNRNDYMRDYMRRRRAAEPTSVKAIMRASLTEIAVELADTETERGLRILALAKKGLGQ